MSRENGLISEIPVPDTSLVHVRGSHHYLHHPGHDCIVTVPVHLKTDTCAYKTLKSIIEQSHLSLEEFTSLL